MDFFTRLRGIRIVQSFHVLFHRHVGPIVLKDSQLKRFRCQFTVPGQLFNGAA